MGWSELRSPADWKSVTESEQPVVIFKHSYRCSISSTAWNRMRSFPEANARIMCYVVDVIADRALSQQIASETGVQHESPQVLVLEQGKAVYHTSHLAIFPDEIRKVIGQRD